MALFCEYAYTKATVPSAINSTAAAVAIFKLFLNFSHHLMKTASQPPIKGFFRIIPESFPNSDAYSIGYDTKDEDVFALKIACVHGTRLVILVGVLWSYQTIELEQKPLSG